MKLKAKDRIVLSGLLPTECGLDKARIVRKLAQSLEFTEDELKRLQVKTDGNQITWKQNDENGDALDVPVDIDISPEGFQLILELFDKLGKQEKLQPLVHLPIYERFLEVISNR